MDYLIIGLILLGAAILFLAMLKTSEIFQLLKEENFRRGWRKLLILMSFFELGYFGMIFIMLKEEHQLLPMLTGVIFLMGSVFVFLVVTMGAKTCQLLKDSNEALEAQMKILKNRNNQLVQFNYATTHDLREPINTILGCSSLLESDYAAGLNEDGLKLLQYTNKAGRRMSELVSSLSDYLSIGLDGKQELVDVKALINEVIASMNGSVSNSNVAIEIGSMPMLKVNKNELKRVFQNLISNAIKYRQADLAPSIKISAMKNQIHSWQFSVEDNGIGISEKDVPRAFQLFRQLHAKDKYDGMGLGLSIAKRVVELHGGTIWLDSKLGKGTTFHFTLDDH